MSSTNFAVINDSRRPTSAIASAYGAMIVSVSIFQGTSGKNNDGKLDGNSPSSPTSGTFNANTTVAAVSSTIATSGAGTTEVNRGRKIITNKPTPTIGYTKAGTPIRCGSCEVKIKIASALTNPTITLRGMKRINLATPRTLSATWKMPARMTVAMK